MDLCAKLPFSSQAYKVYGSEMITVATWLAILATNKLLITLLQNR